MSAVFAVPELMAEAATDLATLGSNLSAAHVTAATATLTVLPAAADEVFASIAHLFSGHAAEYQKLAGKAAAFHDQFVQHVTASASAYASAEAANVSLLTADAAASIPLLDPFIKYSTFASELITLISANPTFYLGVFLALGVLLLPFVPLAPLVLLLEVPNLLLYFSSLLIGWP